MLKLMILGAGGRMGRETIRAAVARPSDFKIVAAVERGSHPDCGRDAGVAAGVATLGVVIESGIREGLARADAVIDFSSPSATVELLGVLAALPKPAVIGTTGLDEGALAAARQAASAGAAILISSNFSWGVAVLKKLVREAAIALEGFDVEVVETHHRNKADAPSGTAKEILKVLRERRSESVPVVHGRSGTDAKRTEAEIGLHSLRGGSVTGEHRVYFLGEGERVEIAHIAESRSIFATGALRALLVLASFPPGVYSMNEVLSK